MTAAPGHGGTWAGPMDSGGKECFLSHCFVPLQFHTMNIFLRLIFLKRKVYRPLCTRNPNFFAMNLSGFFFSPLQLYKGTKAEKDHFNFLFLCSDLGVQWTEGCCIHVPGLRRCPWTALSEMNRMSPHLPSLHPGSPPGGSHWDLYFGHQEPYWCTNGPACSVKSGSHLPAYRFQLVNADHLGLFLDTPFSKLNLVWKLLV